MNEELIEENKEKEEIVKENKEDEKEEKEESKKTNKNLINYILIAVLIVAAVALLILDYPKISKFVQSRNNPLGFDYNFNKVRDHDWDTLITEKKIAKALGAPIQKINSAKNPDYSWVLEEPEQFVKEIKCASLIDEKILNEIDESTKNLFNINLMICNTKIEAQNTFSSRKNEIDNIEGSNQNIRLENIQDTPGIGEKGYTYLVNKVPSSEEQDSGDQRFGGIVFLRGPFVVMIDESEQKGLATLSNKKDQGALAKFIDNQLKKILTWY